MINNIKNKNIFIIAINYLTKKTNKWIGYLAVILIELLLIVSLLYINPYIPIAKYPIVYVLVVMFAAYLYGIGEAIVAFYLGIIVYGLYFQLIPILNYTQEDNIIAGWVAFFLGNSIVGFTILSLQSSKIKVVSLNRKLEDELIERDIMEDALKDSEEMFKNLAITAEYERSQLEAVINGMNQGVILIDPQKKVLNINPAGTALLNCDASDVIGYRLDALISQIDIARIDEKPMQSFPELVNLTINQGGIENLELIVKGMKNKDYFFGSFNALPIFNKNHELILIILLFSDITKRIISEQREREIEKSKIDFYRNTILAATGGKLVIADKSEIIEKAGEPVRSWDINDISMLMPIRHEIIDIADRKGMESSRIDKFVISVGEVIANAFKYAGSGSASLHQLPDGLMFIIYDHGPGIEELNLPNVALKDRYSTAGTLGMGYKVMLSFCDRVYLSTGADGTVVALVMRYLEKDDQIDIDISDSVLFE